MVLVNHGLNRCLPGFLSLIVDDKQLLVYMINLMLIHWLLYCHLFIAVIIYGYCFACKFLLLMDVYYCIINMVVNCFLLLMDIWQLYMVSG